MCARHTRVREMRAGPIRRGAGPIRCAVARMVRREPLADARQVTAITPTAPSAPHNMAAPASRPDL
jgi:hypothetical protein